jgi:hypothetical protein
MKRCSKSAFAVLDHKSDRQIIFIESYNNGLPEFSWNEWRLYNTNRSTGLVTVCILKNLLLLVRLFHAIRTIFSQTSFNNCRSIQYYHPHLQDFVRCPVLHGRTLRFPPHYLIHCHEQQLTKGNAMDTAEANFAGMNQGLAMFGENGLSLPTR